MIGQTVMTKDKCFTFTVISFVYRNDLFLSFLVCKMSALMSLSILHRHQRNLRDENNEYHLSFPSLYRKSFSYELSVSRF